MQGLVAFSLEIAQALAILLPTFCYIAAIGLFLSAGWGFWRMAQPDNPWRGKPWVPVMSLILCGVFASFDRILTLANHSGGSDVTVGLASSLTGYTPATPPGGNVLGATPGETILNVVTIFQYFFQAFGAMIAFFAIYTWWNVMRGVSNRRPGGCFVQFAFGVMLINVLQISSWLVEIFRANA